MARVSRFQEAVGAVQLARARGIVDGQDGPAAPSSADAPAREGLLLAAGPAAHGKEAQRALARRFVFRESDQMGDVGEESSTSDGEPVCLDVRPSRIIKVAGDRGDQAFDRAGSDTTEPAGAAVAGAAPPVAQAQLHVVQGRVRLGEVEGVGAARERGRISSQRGVDGTWAKTQTLAAHEPPAGNGLRAHDDDTSSHHAASVDLSSTVFRLEGSGQSPAVGRRRRLRAGLGAGRRCVIP